MARTAYVDGRYGPLGRAAVPVEDRALQFGDGVYEVVAVLGGRPVDLDRHLRRLAASREGLGIAAPMADGALRAVVGEVLRRNRIRDGLVYVQVTRGRAPRGHAFPRGARPSLIVAARPARPAAPELMEGVAVVTAPDQRWGRCDLKTTALLANVLAKQRAAEAGAFECWMVDAEGRVTEGASSNAWIVEGGRARTRPPGTSVLAGITRAAVIEAAAAEGIPVEERAFTPAEARAADEAFLTSTSSFVVPVVEIDGEPAGGGRPGAVTRRLAAAYAARARGG